VVSYVRWIAGKFGLKLISFPRSRGCARIRKKASLHQERGDIGLASNTCTVSPARDCSFDRSSGPFRRRGHWPGACWVSQAQPNLHWVQPSHGMACVQTYSDPRKKICNCITASCWRSISESVALYWEYRAVSCGIEGDLLNAI